ncbi:MAG: porin [Armatimonadota bacterium]
MINCWLTTVLGSSAWVAAEPAASAEQAPTIRSYFQLRFTVPEGQASYVSLRRLKIMIDGSLSTNAGYYLQAIYKDGNRSATDGQPYLQEARIWLQRGRSRITFGQTKPPFGWERFTNDYALASIDRSPATDRLIPDGNLGDSFARDRGVEWDYQAGTATYSVGLFDGAGANNGPHGFGPLVVGRVLVEHKARHPRAAVFHGEVALAWRRAHGLDFTNQLPGSKPLGYADFRGHDWRTDAAVGWRKPRWEVRAEYLRAAYRPAGDTAVAVNAEGGYVQAAYDLSRRWQVALKYDAFNVQHGHWLEQWTVGCNLMLCGVYERVQVNGLLRQSGAGSSAPDALVVQYQRFF